MGPTAREHSQILPDAPPLIFSPESGQSGAGSGFFLQTALYREAIYDFFRCRWRAAWRIIFPAKCGHPAQNLRKFSAGRGRLTSTHDLYTNLLETNDLRKHTTLFGENLRFLRVSKNRHRQKTGSGTDESSLQRCLSPSKPSVDFPLYFRTLQTVKAYKDFNRLTMRQLPRKPPRKPSLRSHPRPDRQASRHTF